MSARRLKVALGWDVSTSLLLCGNKSSYGRKGLSELTVQGCRPPWLGWQELETTLPAVTTVRKQREVHARAQLAYDVLSSLGA